MCENEGGEKQKKRKQKKREMQSPTLAATLIDGKLEHSKCFRTPEGAQGEFSENRVYVISRIGKRTIIS